MKTKTILANLIILMLALNSCQQNSAPKASENKEEIGLNQGESENQEDSGSKKAASAAEILARPQVPILCYHQIRNWTATDGKMGKDYIVPIAEFKSQMKMLADSGYHTILPDQLYDYLVYGKKLPKKPIMLTFDDTKLDQYTAAIPEMNKYGFKGVFFIMTVSIGKANYMSKAQIKELSDAGHVIGSHTYDHQNV
ncbi:polysaccharide deacetylase family protein, partial [Daejeonella sp.]|uniref:polysaccharide deacetylase family protein n=1 Tax=Daejeonella sp. TaxID=2805397 RepID=UPI0037831517